MNKLQKLWLAFTWRQRLNPYFTADHYRDLITKWKDDYGFISFTDYDKSGIMLRHDIDNSLDKAVRMAEIESDINNHDSIMFNHGITPIVQSTYFALNTAKYWDSREMIPALLYIQSLGHEIGWHNNSIADWFRSNDAHILSYIQLPIDYLRENGITIHGTSAHGDRLCFQNRFLNYNVFGFKSPGFDWYEGPYYPLNKFGLEYETYFVPYDDYAVDSYQGWAKNPEWIVMKGKRIQILIHPAAWRI